MFGGGVLADGDNAHRLADHHQGVRHDPDDWHVAKASFKQRCRQAGAHGHHQFAGCHPGAQLFEHRVDVLRFHGHDQHVRLIDGYPRLDGFHAVLVGQLQPHGRRDAR